MLDESIEIDSEINTLLHHFLNILTHARKKEFIKMAKITWDNPQISLLIQPNKDNFNNKSFLSSMKELRAFMISNRGFKSL